MLPTPLCAHIGRPAAAVEPREKFVKSIAASAASI